MSVKRPKVGLERMQSVVPAGGVMVGVVARQGVGDGVKAARTILDGEVKAKELADPLMLRHGRQPLVQ